MVSCQCQHNNWPVLLMIMLRVRATELVIGKAAFLSRLIMPLHDVNWAPHIMYNVNDWLYRGVEMVIHYNQKYFSWWGMENFVCQKLGTSKCPNVLLFNCTNVQLTKAFWASFVFMAIHFVTYVMALIYGMAQPTNEELSTTTIRIIIRNVQVRVLLHRKNTQEDDGVKTCFLKKYSQT